ncbi:MAG: VanW family protein [Armatimonadota bacterium]|nr:VanW family protein [Armatimonadota bacterium]
MSRDSNRLFSGQALQRNAKNVRKSKPVAHFAVGFLLIAGFSTAVCFVSAPPEHEIGSYATSLRNRKQSQVHNACLAVKAINNTIVPPGGIFSFHKVVGPWTIERGYVEAPVSYNGELIRDLGGGVCQASSTLYNAALLAGLEILERHRHHWPARYAPLGRDAAVAYPDADLRFRNNLPAPVRIVGRIECEKLVFSVLSRCRPPYSVRIRTEVRSVVAPSVVVQGAALYSFGGSGAAVQGRAGFHVVTYREFVFDSRSRTQVVSEDFYPAFHRVVRAAKR